MKTLDIHVINETSTLAQNIAGYINSKGICLWLLSGGSCVRLQIEVSSYITEPKSVTVMLVDERYGKPGHGESNWQKLIDLGFDFGAFESVAILTGQDSESSSQHMAEFIHTKLNDGHTVAGIFGVGIDGHTAGLLPGSTIIDSSRFVDHYQTPEFERISITPELFQHIDIAWVYTEGNAKAALLNKLAAGENGDMPMYALRRCKTLELYNKQ